MKHILLVASICSLWLGMDAAKLDAVANSAQQIAEQENKTNVGNCSPSTTQVDLDINNVRARILGGGDFWWDGVDLARYEVPKVDQSSNAIPVNAIFAGALWFSGLDDAGNLKVAAQTYRGQGHDFWTGPLDVLTGEVEFASCNAFDEHFVVYGEEIDAFIGAYIAGNNNIVEADIPENIKNWPGIANPFLAGTPRFYDSGSLAPFYDNNDDGIYNPLDGDYPVIGVTSEDAATMTDTVVPTYADQMIFWVLNDNGQVHGRTGGEALGVQVNCLAFAYQTSNELNDMTFYTYEIVKRSPGNLFETYMGVFVDPDLGNFQDDYIGCDIGRAMGFVYNANAIDPQYGSPPIVGVDYFEGPKADDGSELGMSSFVYFNNAISGDQTDPDVAAEFRNYQTGRWKSGVPVTEGGTGIGGSTPTNYVYPGNPALCNVPGEWSECNADDDVTGSCAANAPDDRRFLQNSGPFTLVPGEFQRITIGVIYVRPDNYVPCPNVEEEIGAADDLAQSLFDNGFQLIDGPDAPTLGIRELSNELIVTLINEPASNNFGEGYVQAAPIPDNGVTYPDSTYLFQGYKIYQLENPNVTAQDLDDPSKAALIFQADLKDGIDNIYNYELSPTGFYNSVLQVEGANEGVTRSFKVVDDQFAEGDRALVNNKTYYFAAIAYAYNNFIPFTFPLGNPLPQLEPYLQGRKNFKVYSAIPHTIDSRNGGTKLNAEFGQSLEVSRLEGQGNGGVAIRLNEATEAAIIGSATGFEDIITYELGKDPLNVKVVDPLSLQNVDFELRLVSGYPDSTLIDENATWELDVFKDGTFVETIVSERNLTRQYEQIIPDYGISLSIGVPEPYNTNLVNGEPVYAPITSEVIYSDLDNTWLTFVPDEGFASPKNWIRSGTEDEDVSFIADIYDSYQYDELGDETFYDPESLFSDLIGGGMAPYCLASNYAHAGVATSGTDLAPNYLYGPGFRWEEYEIDNNNEIVSNQINNLDKLQSIEIVINNDFQNSWSRCVVLETGEDEQFTEGNVTKGYPRDNPTFGAISNFPGYAINTETGERLYITFGESSDYGDNNGTDLQWNPTSRLYDQLTDIPGTEERVPIWGGKHFIYVYDWNYYEAIDMFDSISDIYDNNPFADAIPAAVAEMYNRIMYTGIPVVQPGVTLERDNTGRVVIPSEVRISISIDRPFEAFETSESTGAGNNGTLPRYSFSTDGLAPEEMLNELAVEALDNIRVVPNPYYAFSAYEASQIDNVVKITNLPDRAIVSIYSMDGKLVRRYDRAVGNSGSVESTRQEITSGQVVGSINLDNSLNWDLTNQERIPVGSGTYIIHIDAPGVGEQVVKAAVFMRPTDVSNF